MSACGRQATSSRKKWPPSYAGRKKWMPQKTSNTERPCSRGVTRGVGVSGGAAAEIRGAHASRDTDGGGQCPPSVSAQTGRCQKFGQTLGGPHDPGAHPQHRPYRGRCRGCEVLLDKGSAGTLRPWGRPVSRRPQDAPQHCGDTALQGNPSIPQGLPPAIVALPPQAGG